MINRLSKGIFNICDKVFLVLKSAGHSDKTCRDTGFFELFVTHLTVSGSCGIETARSGVCNVCFN